MGPLSCARGGASLVSTRRAACTPPSLWSVWPSMTLTGRRSGARARGSTRSPSGPRRSRAGYAAALRSSPLSRRARCGPKYTVSPVYEGMLKEEMDRAAENSRDVRYDPQLIDATYALLLTTYGEP